MDEKIQKEKIIKKIRKFVNVNPCSLDIELNLWHILNQINSEIIPMIIVNIKNNPDYKRLINENIGPDTIDNICNLIYKEYINFYCG